MKKSLTLKLFIIIFCAIFLTTIVGLVTISLYSKSYYLKYRMDDFKDSLKPILVETFDTDTLDKFASSKNAYIELYSKDMEHLYSSNYNFKNINFPMKNRDIKKPRKITSNFIKRNDDLYTWTGFINDEYIAFIAIPSKDISSIVGVIQTLLLILLPVGIILAIIAALFVSRYVSRPIIKLNNTARKIGQLNFRVNYEMKRDDEIGELSNTLNWLSNQLDNAFSQLRGELEKEKKLDKLRKSFIAQVSHELKTPVAVINSYTEAILDDIPQSKGETDQYLTVIKNECIKVSQMIKSLLDISQIESGVIKINKEQINVKLMLEQIFKRHNEIIKSISFTLENVSPDIFILGDINKLTQVIDNFVQNAVKYTPADGFIKIGAVDKGKYIDIYVENKGEVVSTEHLPHIWESFYKVGNKSGSGLGLSIAKNILTAHAFRYYSNSLNYGMRFGFLADIKN